jgi:hypothetical protein
VWAKSYGTILKSLKVKSHDAFQYWSSDSQRVHTASYRAITVQKNTDDDANIIINHVKKINQLGHYIDNDQK